MTTKTITSMDRKLAEVILNAYRAGFSVQSDYARTTADYVAMAASLGLLSTRVVANIFSREWRPTVKGLEWLEDVFGEEVDYDDTLDEGHN